ncbi:serine/threonine-protein kinase [Mycolicibacterium sp. Dal123E01]|uniref:serine/threonine-protein kinase n=1 Tax=Mycolicibacterium sp. Dal123E01 TaxID=3457578 RepID=UPI00403E4BDD
MLPEGTDIGGYRIERVLGSGGMGTVYLARHPQLPRSDALKVLSAEFSVDPEFRARFLREADLAAMLDHPNIVRVYSRGTTASGQLWIAMQFVDGTDAGAQLTSGPMRPQRVAHIVGQIARALDYAHQRGIVHRDIKPANFLLSGAPGPQERVLLADFGIARALNESTRLTATGAMVATVAYAAPEVIDGRPSDYRADIYSLGCTLYRMLTNKAPFAESGTLAAMMLAHVQQPPPRVTDAVPGLPAAINEVVATAMAKDPAGRYRSARELAAEAAAALGHPEATVMVAPLPAHTNGPQSSASWSPTVAAPVQHHSRPNDPAPPPAAPNRRRWLLPAALVSVTAVVAASIFALTRPSSPELPPYQSQAFNQAFGTATVDHRPTAVAALSLSDADTVLSLGVQPVAVHTGTAATPSWLKSLIHSTPTMLGPTDTGPLVAAKPDVIIDTAADQQTYTSLAAIATTITRPADPAAVWGPAAQIAWIGRVLGAQDAAAALQQKSAVDQTGIRQQNPGFIGKTVAVVDFSETGLSAALSESPAASYLTGLGFVYPADLTSTASGQLDRPVQNDGLYALTLSNLVVVIRTDKDAAGGGINGLPAQLTSGPNLVVVDDPDTVAALRSGGPAATSYLNTSWVSTLATKLG